MNEIKLFEVAHHTYADSAGNSHDDYIVTCQSNESCINDLSRQDLVHLRDFLNDYLCSEGGNNGKGEGNEGAS